jgi:Flp pilus assembly pilin Flp
VKKVSISSQNYFRRQQPVHLETNMFNTRASQRGQGMTEYIIIVALIAIAAITVYNIFGDTVRGQVGDLAAELGGGTATDAGAAAASKANTEAGADYGLTDFKQDEAR